MCLTFGYAQKQTPSTLKFTNDLQNFTSLTELKKALRGVEIIALGENTHGLGEVFRTKAELVKFLHQEMGFGLLLFESGFGDGALAWEQLPRLSAKAYTKAFTSNYYYHSKEILSLMNYVKAKAQTKQPLLVQGIDCQPQQGYLITQMQQLIDPIDAAFANTIKRKMREFNLLYHHEHKKDSVAFYKQRKQFIQFINQCQKYLNDPQISSKPANKANIALIKKTLDGFKKTYQNIPYGGMMSWPLAYNIRDKAMFEAVQPFRKKYPRKKIIIWAQNSHIENIPKPNDRVQWMGHHLKKTYGKRYYSVGAIVYSGRDLRYNKTATFEHKKTDYLAYRLEQYQQTSLFINLRSNPQPDFLSKPLLGMESNGNEAVFAAKTRFDGILFIHHSDIPQLLKE
ncbi:hypothetical protein BKI52_45285 [marine bacterium AO1-C]|nr:hypothetical protein BKI52_45285 [marine bacterium AO1-C]